jgi:thioredoxin-like negative regulator of GroEL
MVALSPVLHAAAASIPGHCKSLKPEYGIADQALKNDADKVQLALFDADADRDFAAAFEVWQ